MIIFFFLARNTAEILPMISSNLASFPVLLENITWIRNFSLADGQLVGQSHMSHRVGLENLKTVGHLMSVFLTSVSYPISQISFMNGFPQSGVPPYDCKLFRAIFFSFQVSSTLS